MDIAGIILEKIRKQGKVKSAEIIRQTGFSRAYVDRFFQKLRDESKIVIIGKANKAHYVLANKQEMLNAKKGILKVARVLQNRGLQEDVVLADIKQNTGIFIGLAHDVSEILDYAFSEMLNNAIEHSLSGKIKVSMEKGQDKISFAVVDEGVGIFNNIMKKKKLHNELEAIQDLLKGKQTTAPKTHSGEGVFFTSKIADLLVIKSSHKKLIFDNLVDDIFVRDVKDFMGTKVTFSINYQSQKSLRGLFREYTDAAFEFSKTKVTVGMYKTGTDYVSRSQARRIISGLEKFQTIVLDFKNVQTVGQGFADEIFRVWKGRRADISIVYKNANENIEFMIKRAQK